jgi:hypothetical protein
MGTDLGLPHPWLLVRSLRPWLLVPALALLSPALGSLVSRLGKEVAYSDGVGFCRRRLAPGKTKMRAKLVL